MRLNTLSPAEGSKKAGKRLGLSLIHILKQVLHAGVVFVRPFAVPR